MLWVFGFIIFHKTRIISPPIYEETNLIRSELRGEIGRIDNAIYESLYERKVPDKNIHFLDVTSKSENGYSWDFIEILVKLPTRDSLHKLEGVLNNAFLSLKPKITCKNRRLSRYESAYHLFALGLYTHKLILRHDVFKKPTPWELPKVGIIIDDLGYDYDMALRLMELDLPLSMAVLPIAPHTKEIVSEVKKRALELMLHLPMEPKNYPAVNPGPGALLASMDDDQIRYLVDDHLKRISGVRGVNNHMGSLFTERRDKMGVVFDELRKRHLFFIDSKTTNHSLAFSLAKDMGIPVAGRSVFLDNDSSPKALKFQMERLLGFATHSGSAIGIGHPNRETLRILKHYLPKLNNEFEMVPVSELVE